MGWRAASAGCGAGPVRMEPHGRARPSALQRRLWQAYFRSAWLDAWGRPVAPWYDPTGAIARLVAEAAAVAAALLVEPQIDRMYRANAPEVTQFAELAGRIDAEVPEEFRLAGAGEDSGMLQREEAKDAKVF